MLHCRYVARIIGKIGRNIQDIVPKMIMYYLVNHVKGVLQNRLVSDLYKEELFSEYLKEDDNVVLERQKLKLQLETYKVAAAILNDIRDMH